MVIRHRWLVLHKATLWIICALIPAPVAAQTLPKTTANQGSSNGWHDPDGVGDGQNHISLLANDDQTVAASSRVYNTLGDPTVGSNLPANDSNYTVTFQLTAATPTVTPGNNSTITALLTTQYSINSGVSWPTGKSVFSGGVHHSNYGIVLQDDHPDSTGGT